MKKPLFVIAFICMSSSALANKLSEVKSIARYSTYGVFAGNHCQVVTHDGSKLSSDQIAILQKRNLHMTHISYRETEGVQTITIDMSDDVVEKLNCQLNLYEQPTGMS